MTKVLSAMGPAPLAFSSSRVAKTTPRPVAASLRAAPSETFPGQASSSGTKGLLTGAPRKRCSYLQGCMQHGKCWYAVWTQQGECETERKACAPAVGAVQVHGLAGDDARREAAELAVLVKEPGHDARVCASGTLQACEKPVQEQRANFDAVCNRKGSSSKRSSCNSSIR